MAEPKEPLTERELEVVRLLTTGVSNKEIAARLHVSPNTIRVHLRNVFTKLEAQSRTEVTMVAVRNGWVDAGTQGSLPPVGGAGVTTASGWQGAQGSVAELVDEQLPVPPPDPGRPSGGVRPPTPAPVPVAPNPQTLPPLALWQRIALIVALLAAVALTTLALQRPSVEASELQNDALSPDNVANPVLDAAGVKATRWYPRASIRTARSRSAIAIANGKVYAIGGEVDREPSNEVLIYDLERDVWQASGRKPTPVMNAGAAVIGNMLYVPGGTTADSLATDRFEALDVQSGEWRVLPSLPRPLAGHAVVASGNRLYVIGGRTLSGISNDSFVFDPETNRWSALDPMPTPRSQLAAAVLNGRIYAVGGYDGKREYTTCEYYQISMGKWHACAPMTIPRGGFGLAQVGSALFAVGGGISNGYVGLNERYDPATDKWVPFEMPGPRLGDWRNVGIASLPTEFYAIGGSTRGVPLSDNYVYEVMNNRTFLPAFQSGGDR